MQFFLRVSALGGLVLALAACSTLGLSGGADKKAETAKGKRESVMVSAAPVQADAAADKNWVKIPSATPNQDWPQAGGNATNTPGHPALPPTLAPAWKADIGDGSGGGLRLLARPVVAGNAVYTMDASGHVAAFSVQSGDRLWFVSTQDEESEADDAIGGGIAFEAGKIFATTGHGTVVALDAQDGHTLWRRKLANPLRAAPTVADGRVYAVSVANVTAALNVADGAVLWEHNGLAQPAALMGAAAPAVFGDTAVVAYSSGEIFALRAQNGRVAGGDALVTPLAAGALPEMADIRGAPVIDHGGVFAVSHSGRMAALVMRSGERAWELDVGGSSTPLVVGNTIFVLTNAQKLLAVRRDNGKVIWTQDLPRLTDPEDRESDPITWTGPILAGGRLLLVNSHEQLAEYGVLDGKVLALHDLPDASFIEPVVAQGTAFVITENGKLVAFR